MCDIQADIDQGNEYPVLDTEATAIMLKDKDDVDTDDSIIVDTKEKSHSEDSPYKLTHLEEVAEAAEAEENNFFSQHSSQQKLATVALTPEPPDTSEEESPKQLSLQALQHNSAPQSYHTQLAPPAQPIEQLYGQISMFDYLTEENDFCRGESDSGDGEGDSTHNIHKFRQKMEVLNQDLHHDQIFDGEDGEDADLDEDSPDVLNTKMKIKVKKSGKPQNLDLLPSNYIYQND